MHIPWDLEATPLQIKTDSLLDSDKIWVDMCNKDSSYISNVAVKFSSQMYYSIHYCTSGWINLPVQHLVEAGKVWTFTKTKTAIIITCGNVEVVNYLFADSSRSDCAVMLAGDVVEQIKFPSYDTSDFYRAGNNKGINTS